MENRHFDEQPLEQHSEVVKMTDQQARFQSMREELMEAQALLGQYQPLKEYYGPAGLRTVSELIAERDKWKDEYEELCKFATDFEQHRDRLKERVRELELAMDPEVRKFLDLASAFHHAEDELVKARIKIDSYHATLLRVQALLLYCLGPTRDVKTYKLQEAVEQIDNALEVRR